MSDYEPRIERKPKADLKLEAAQNVLDGLEDRVMQALDEQTKLGKRFNSGKLRWRNFPLFLIEPLIQVAHAGEQKYGTFNFLEGQTVNNCLDSLIRHYVDAQCGQDIDPDSGAYNLAAVAWNALVALHMIRTRPELDDRYKLPEGVERVKAK